MSGSGSTAPAGTAPGVPDLDRVAVLEQQLSEARERERTMRAEREVARERDRTVQAELVAVRASRVEEQAQAAQEIAELRLQVRLQVSAVTD